MLHPMRSHIDYLILIIIQHLNLSDTHNNLTNMQII